jgi:hypothetical protein
MMFLTLNNNHKLDKELLKSVPDWQDRSNQQERRIEDLV